MNPGRRLRWMVRVLLLLLSVAVGGVLAEGILGLLDLHGPLPAFLTRDQYLAMVSSEERARLKSELPEGFFFARDVDGMGPFPIPPGRFAIEKPAGIFRIFAFGGSTTYGLPFTQAAGRKKDLSFPSWLRLRLKGRFAGRPIEVHNVGAIGQTFEGAVQFAKECLHYQPDAFLFYSGHNEYLPHALLLARARARSSFVLRAGSPFLDYRLGRLWQNWMVSIQERVNPRVGTLDFPVVERMVDACYHTEEESEVMRTGYRRCLEGLWADCRRAGVRLILCTVACNLVDFEPSLSCPSSKASESDRQRWTDALRATRDLLRGGDARGSLNLLDALDPAAQGLAEACFIRGRAQLELGLREKGLLNLKEARDRDGVVRRAPSWVNEELRASSDRHPEILKVDLEQEFEAGDLQALPGRLWFFDHVHPNRAGTAKIVDALERAIVESRWLGEAGMPERRSTEQELNELGYIPEMIGAVHSTQALAYGGLILLRLYDARDRLAEARALIEAIPAAGSAFQRNAQVLLGLLEVLAGEQDSGKARLEALRSRSPREVKDLIQSFLDRAQSPVIRDIFRRAGLCPFESKD